MKRLIGEYDMNEIIFVIEICIWICGLFLYMKKRFENKTTMGKNIMVSMVLCIVALGFYGFFVLAKAAGLNILARICNTLVWIANDWLLCFLWMFLLEYTGMHKTKQAAVLKKGFLVLTAILTVLANFQYITLHMILSAVMIFSMIGLLFVKQRKAPAIYKRKYSSVTSALWLMVVVKVVLAIRSVEVLDISLWLESLFLIFLYHITFEHKQNDFVQRMQMLIVEDMKNPLLLFDYEYHLASVNRKAEELFHLSERYETRMGIYTLEDFIKEFNFSMIDDIEADKEFEWTRNGAHYHVEYKWLIDYKTHKKKAGVIFAFLDTTVENRAAWKTEYMLTHDQLTGLYNRNYLNINEDKLICEANYPISVAIVNINGMKMINDFYGHSRGDEVIVAIGEMLQANMRSKDIPLRVDGDEFMIIMPKTEEREAVGYMEAITQIITDVVAPELGIGVEFGVNEISKEDDTLESAQRIAKNIMYQKKMLTGKGVKSSVIESLKKALKESDFETEEHVVRTKNMAIRLGERLNISDKEKSELGLLAILHDIGKLSIPDAVLKKPGKLTEEEWEIMKNHTFKGYEIANTTPELAPIAQYILHHHERWDGKGYPEGLKGEEIPLLSRIITLIDSHDVMTHDRPYHKAMSAEDAVQEVIRCSGTQFDPELVKAFLEMLEEEKKDVI